MTALRWGILATGGIAHAFTADLKTAGLTVTAVGSRRSESAQEFAAKYGIPRSYGSYDELVADPEVDIVYIATPHSHHLACAALALEHGKHVLIEKPLTLDADQAVAIRDLAADHGLLAMEAMWTRYLPHMVRLREILAAGVIGEVRVLSADHTQNLPTDPDHRLNDLALGGGALLDLGIYPVSFAWDVLGAPAEILATAQLGETGADTDVAISVRHASGGVSSLLTSMRGAGANAAQIVGTKGRIEIDGVFYAPTSFRVFDVDGAVVEEFRAEIDGRGMQFQALYAEQLIAEGRTDSDLLPMDESVAIMGTLDEIRRQIGVVYPRS
ncbi:putative dehydrogenase [Microbacterium sp. SORGH_AS 505]|uniref:Gfo/Idh/MocA family protein n=1 Tax=Microbacterium sp. SORGH_AS_0505 TaxID=3041770 RepID=UPI00278B6374|nr:Gfo/Idh/MocA family oxidoreductase [Microbacterium sp. SORGH_AS_0505]MDQ1127817.1 putative dehydrogenase [Microbacterium sp. SORGH_AS_0505]